MTEWDDATKHEIYTHLAKKTTSRTTKRLLKACLARIDVLERANASFGNSMTQLTEQLPGILQTEIDRVTSVRELRVTPPKELGDGVD